MRSYCHAQRFDMFVLASKNNEECTQKTPTKSTWKTRPNSNFIVAKVQSFAFHTVHYYVYEFYRFVLFCYQNSKN